MARKLILLIMLFVVFSSVSYAGGNKAIIDSQEVDGEGGANKASTGYYQDISHQSSTMYSGTTFKTSHNYNSDLIAMKLFKDQNPTAAQGFRLWVYNDNAGVPYSALGVSSWNDGTNLSAVDTTNWINFTLNTSVSFIKNTVMHIIIQGNVTDTTNEIRSYLSYQNSPGNNTENSEFGTVGSWGSEHANSQLNYRIYNSTSGGGTPPAGDTPSIVSPPTPADGVTNASQVDISFSCATENVSLWFGSSNPPTTLVVDNSSTGYANYTTSVISDGTYYYRAGCSGGELSTVYSWSYDTVIPNIFLNDQNTFTKYNITRKLYYDSLYLDMNFSDNIDLFAYQIFINSTNGTMHYNSTNTSLSGTSQNFNDVVDWSNWDYTNYTIDVYLADSHTNNYIKDWDITKSADSIIFNTEEGNTVTLFTGESVRFDYEKLQDRYKIFMNYDTANINKKRTIYLECSRKLYYKQNSKYAGHFVCGDAFGGNWIDFETKEKLPEKINAKKITDTRYEITFKTKDKTVEFNSIGGLNVEHKTYLVEHTTINTSYASISPNGTALNIEPLKGQCYIYEPSGRNVYIDYQWYKNGELYINRSINISTCYQEDFTVSYSCGGVSGGSYSSESLFIDSYKVVDEDYNSYGYSFSGNKHLYINYIQPEYVEGATWQIKDGAGLRNVSIPDGCLNRNNNLSIVITSDQLNNKVYWKCKNITSIGNTEEGQLIYTGASKLVYEEAIFWNTSSSSKVASNAFINVNNISEGITSDGDNWSIRCRGYNEGNYTNWLMSSNTTIESYSIDNCSTYTSPAFTIYTRNEKSNALIHTNGSFTFTYYSKNYPNVTKQTTILWSDNSTYNFCKYPSNVTLYGDFSHVFTAGGYEQKNLNRYDVMYNGTFAAYLLPIDVQTQTVLFNIVNNTYAPEESALFSVYRIVDGKYKLVYQQETDVAGQASTVMDTTYNYMINVSKAGYPPKIFYLQPVLSIYTVKLNSGGSTFYDNEYTGIRYRIRPRGNKFNISNDFTYFHFDIAGTGLEYYGFNFSRHNFECDPINCKAEGTNSIGGTVTLGIKINETGRFYANLYFKPIGGEIVYINEYPYDGIIARTALRSTVQFFQDIKENLSPMAVSVMGTLFTVIMVGIASQLGLIGFGLFFVALMSIAILSVPAIGFINPVFGGIVVMIGMIVYAFGQRVQQ